MNRVKRNRIYVTASTADWQTPVRVALNPEAAIEINDKHWATGITLDRLWFGKNRIITQAYSIWDDGRGRCAGTFYRAIYDQDDILQICHKAGIEPPTWIAGQEV